MGLEPYPSFYTIKITPSINLPFAPDQPQDQQVQTEDPKDVPITECHKLFPHTLTFLNERSSGNPHALVVF